MQIAASRWIPLLVLPLALSACVDPEVDEDVEDDASEAPESMRGTRVCELFELRVEGEHLAMDVWNSGALHDCPDEWLAAIDSSRYAVGGPRWRSVDEQRTVDAEGEPVEFDGEPLEVPAGLGQDMFLAAQVQLMPLAGLEQMLGVSIESIEDLPPQVHQTILDATLASEDYAIREVSRELTTRMVHHAGNDVFVIDDSECRYAMKYYTSIIDPTLTNEDEIAKLADKFQHLPEGWSFEVLRFEEDLVIAELDGTAIVLTDEFGNSYDRYACD